MDAIAAILTGISSKIFSKKPVEEVKIVKPVEEVKIVNPYAKSYRKRPPPVAITPDQDPRKRPFRMLPPPGIEASPMDDLPKGVEGPLEPESNPQDQKPKRFRTGTTQRSTNDTKLRISTVKQASTLKRQVKPKTETSVVPSASRSPRLGRLVVGEGVHFGWQGAAVGSNEKLGRVYFGGFVLQKKSFATGDTVEMTAQDLSSSTYVIASVFQATKSFLGHDLYSDSGDRHDIQHRGHPYMELQRVDRKQVEFLPDWILEPTLKIDKTATSNISRAKASKHWSKKLGATQVHCLDDSSDNSDCSHDKRVGRGQKAVNKKIGNARQLSPPKQARLRGLKPAAQHHASAARIYRGPAVQLVVHDSTDLSKFFNTRESRNGQYKGEAEDCIKEVERLFVDVAPLANELRQKWLEQQHSRVHASDLIDIVHDDQTPADQVLDGIRAKFYDSPFRSPQYRVCKEILNGRHECGAYPVSIEIRDDIFFVAPCGFGKSLCFVVAANALRGITLVIEPLRALIDSQVNELRRRGINVEILLTLNDARSQRKSYAALRLNELAQHHNGDPLILFSTPELMERCFDGVRSLTNRDLLSLVVIDEFDCIDESNDIFRKMYRELVPKLKDATQSAAVPFLYLSATGSTALIAEVLEGRPASKQAIPGSSRPILFLSKHVLPPMHVYSVERKVSLEQVVDRMAKVLGDFRSHQGLHHQSMGQTPDRPRCICYCLTPRCCLNTVNAFRAKGIEADVFDGTQTDSHNKSVLGKLHNGKLQVICATKSLGRGVHIECPIRFIFHPVMPVSLTGSCPVKSLGIVPNAVLTYPFFVSAKDYVQATGRGGRDGGICYCILFYRHQDCALVMNVLRQRDLCDEDKKRHKMSVENVCKYAMEGYKCRTSMLTREALVISGSTNLRSVQQCLEPGVCDNCRFRDRNYGKVEVSEHIRNLLHSAKDFECPSDLLKKARDLWKSKNCEISAVLANQPLLDALSRHLTLKSHFEETATKEVRLATWCRRLEQQLLSFHLQYSNLDSEPEQSPMPQIRGQAWFDVEDGLTGKMYTRSKWLALPIKTEYPYLVRFEAQRLKLNLDTQRRLPNGLSAACECLYEEAGQKSAPYFRVLKEAEKRGTMPASNSLFFRAELQDNGQLELHEPEQAHDRRIYRMYGSDRLLEVSVSAKVSDDTVQKFFSKSVSVGGRVFRYFWCKKDKNPQAYVLFAEKGCNIPTDEEFTVSDVIERCIPPANNPELTLGQMAKRMKLNFSVTTVGCQLPPGSVQMLADFGSNGVTEIDGAGLISRKALDDIWSGYRAEGGKPSEVEACPYSGFQGRLAGFKGVWILDSCLDGFVVQCRSSQLKYSAPMKCLDLKAAQVDDVHALDTFYETIEVSSFCKPVSTRLNTRLVQILEHQATRAKKWPKLWDFLKQSMEETIKEINDLADGDAGALVQKLKRRLERFDNEEAEKKDSRMLFRMAAANVGHDEPEFRRRRVRLIKNMFASIRDKAHYSVKDCCDVRIYPDHTQLLYENEAFLASLSENATEVVAMRSPSFFANDVRRLKLVSYETLFQRAQQCVQHQDVKFFKGIKNALVLPIPEAGRMSGGDYDGDRAWICWNNDLIQCLPEVITAEDTSNRATLKSDLEQKPWSESCMDDSLKYMIHFRGHQRRLGQLSEELDLCIDKYGFDDPATKELGRAAFLQVDMPYHPYAISNEVRDTVQRNLKHGWPDWKNRGKAYESRMALGLMFRQMTETMLTLSDARGRPKSVETSSTIIIKNFLCRCQDVDLKDKMDHQAEQTIRAYIKERQLKLKSDSKENFYAWQSNYCSGKRKELIEGISTDPARDQSCLMAATLYFRCHLFEVNDKTCKACELAWLVCECELLRIFSGSDSLPVSRECLPMLISNRR